MNKNNKYHSQIEENFVTSGEDIGRVSNKELAHDVAAAENEQRDLRLSMIEEGFPINSNSSEKLDKQRNTYIKAELAKRAVSENVDGLIHNIAVSGLNEEQLTSVDIDVKNLQKEAAAVGRDYDSLQKKVKVEKVKDSAAEFAPEDLSLEEKARIDEAVLEMTQWYEAHPEAKGDGWATIASGLVTRIGYKELGDKDASMQDVTPQQMAYVHALYKGIVS